MSDVTKKCPNCAHVFQEGETHCPNCDLFVPIEEQAETTEPSYIEKRSTQLNKMDAESTESISNHENIPQFKHRNRKTSDDDMISEQDETKAVNPVIPVVPVVDTKKTTIEDFAPKNTDAEPQEKQELDKESDESFEQEVSQDEDTKIMPTPIPVAKVEDKTTVPAPTGLDDYDEEEDDYDDVTVVANPKQKKSNKLLIGIIAVLLVGGGTYAYQAEQRQQELEQTLKQSNTVDESIDQLYVLDMQSGFLKDNVSEKDLEAIQTQLNDLKGSVSYDRLLNRFEQAQNTFKKEQEINALFKEPIIKDNTLNEKAYLKDKQAVTLTPINEEKTSFDALYNKAIEEAKKQDKAKKDLEQTISKLYQDEKVVASPNEDDYKVALKQLELIKDPADKKQNTEILDKVKKQIDSKKAQKEKESQAVAEQQALAESVPQAPVSVDPVPESKVPAVQSQENNVVAQEVVEPITPYSPTIKDSDRVIPQVNGKWGTRKDASIDLSNPAWTWTPGVKEGFINEVISRGYVVEGGYTLIPKFIEGGVGFYDLYATANSPLFPSSKPEEYPIYIVTVNAKTGWFKGNGPN